MLTQVSGCTCESLLVALLSVTVIFCTSLDSDQVNQHCIAAKDRAAGNASRSTCNARIPTEDVAAKTEDKRVTAGSAAVFHSWFSDLGQSNVEVTGAAIVLRETAEVRERLPALPRNRATSNSANLFVGVG
jgi:hypothetical protein